MTASESAMPWGGEDDAASARAAEFLARRRGGDWSDVDEAELDAWLAQSVLNEVAYLRVEGIAARGDRLGAFRALKLRQASPEKSGTIRYRRFLFPLLAAASIPLIALLAAPFVASFLQPPDHTDSTNVGGRTLLKFSDGTNIELNTDTTVRFRMTSAERTVWLEKGEAWFSVSHNAANPFTVVVGNHRVTDLGTEFLVRRSADGVDVSLVKGRASLSGDGARAATLAPGDEAVATPVSLSVTRKTPQQLADELAWRNGMVVFDHTPLADAVREFNRYNEVKLVIADPAIAGLTIGGKFQTNNVDTFLALVSAVLDVHVERTGSAILLSRDKAGKTAGRKHRL